MRVVWLRTALRNLHDIAAYIARDNPARPRAWWSVCGKPRSASHVTRTAVDRAVSSAPAS